MTDTQWEKKLKIRKGLYVASGMGKQGTIIVPATNKEQRDRLSAASAKIAGAPEAADRKDGRIYWVE